MCVSIGVAAMTYLSCVRAFTAVSMSS